MDEQVLREIMQEIRELRLLYKTLVDKLVSVDDAAQDEKEAIEEGDEYADEDEILKALR